jgi:excisionase family DNA binding protein
MSFSQATRSPILTLDQAADLLRLTPNAVVRMIQAGDLRALRLDGAWRIARADLEACANAHANMPSRSTRP